MLILVKSSRRVCIRLRDLERGDGRISSHHAERIVDGHRWRKIELETGTVAETIGMARGCRRVWHSKQVCLETGGETTCMLTPLGSCIFGCKIKS